MIFLDINYITDRLDKQMEYYHKKCVSLRNEYYRFSAITIIINAIIPVLSMGVDTIGALKYVIASVSALSSILSSMLLLRKTKDTWVRYRYTYEALKKEKILFQTASGKYRNGTEEDFILTCEAIMESENNAWKELLQKNDSKKE